jgi:glycosyltransferase involved in cell wall biosynthesis
MLSIIIPTLNEEDFLPRLLKSIQKQDFKDEEVIVADAGSTDKTREIAQQFGARVIKGGLPATGRNRGARAARGELLLFLDADVILPDDFLEKMLEEFEKRKLDVASILVDPQTNKNTIKWFFEYFYNFPVKKLEKFLPYGMIAFLVKKSLHQKIKGFDEKIKLGEDVDYTRRAAKAGRFGVLKNVKISFCLRRFYHEGWLKAILKYAVLAQLHYQFLGPIKSDIFKYKFGHYKRGKRRQK